MDSTTIKDFESAIAELETIVKKLEEAERRVELLTERGEVTPAPPSLGVDPGEVDRSR